MATYTDPTVVAVGKSNKVQPGPVIALVAGILALGLAGFFFMQTLAAQNQKTTLDGEIATKQDQLNSLGSTAKQLDTLTQQATNLNTLFSNQERWELILGKVEERLYKHMSVTAMQLGSDGTFTMTGTTNDYVDYAKIFSILTDADGQKYFSQAKPVSVARTEAKDGHPAQITFTFNLTLNPDLLKLTTVTH